MSVENTSNYEPEMPPQAGGNFVDDSMEATESATHLSRKELGLVTNFVQDQIDSNPTSPDYSGGIRALDSLAKSSGEESGLAKLALTAATIGGFSRSPETFGAAAPSMVQVAEHDMGLPAEHIDTFMQMNTDNMRRGNDPYQVGENLRNGLNYLDARKRTHQEDISRSRIAMLSSSFAATKDADLRGLIYSQLVEQS